MNYFTCKSCIGYIVENELITSSCLRSIKKGHSFDELPNCPKIARGVDIISTPKWEQISQSEFNELWKIGEELNAKIHIYSED